MAGYSGTPLVRKLGIKPGMTCAVLDAPEHYWELLVGVPEDLTIVDASGSGIDFVHLFVQDQKDLDARLNRLRSTIAQDGMIWVSWPKKPSGVETDVTEDVVRQSGLSAGLVDVKVCAIDAVWSGLKFVIPKKDRR
ncbi:MAG: DUF3052 family protein [Longimicrobiales bacterium]